MIFGIFTLLFIVLKIIKVLSLIFIFENFKWGFTLKTTSHKKTSIIFHRCHLPENKIMLLVFIGKKGATFFIIYVSAFMSKLHQKNAIEIQKGIIKKNHFFNFFQIFLVFFSCCFKFLSSFKIRKLIIRSLVF